MAKTRKRELAEAPLTEIEKIRAQTMMRNNHRLQSLGLPAIASMIRKTYGGRGGSTASSVESSAITQGESSDYHPRDDQVTEEADEGTVKIPRSRKKKSAIKKKSTRKHRSGSETPTSMPPGRVFADAPGGTKRHLEVVDERPLKRVTRKTAAEVSAAINHEETPLRNNDRSSVQMERESQSMDEGSTVRRDLSPIVRADMDQDLFDSDGFLDPEVQMSQAAAPVSRKRKGKGLERLTKGLGAKVTIEIAPGMKRPVQPLQAAKFASEGGMIARGQMPLFPHFKDYKKDKNILPNFVGKVGANFNMDTESEVIQKACGDVLKNVSKNRRHIIKRVYFDKMQVGEISLKSPVKKLSDEEWQALTALWLTPRHRTTCMKNKENREKVKFQHKTGSRSYAAHVHEAREERKGEELDAIELFKLTHNSKKDGYSEEVKIAIANMDAEMASPMPEGAPPKSAVEVVAKVLTKECKYNTFLKNVGLQPGFSSKPSAAAVSAHVLDLEDQLKRSVQQSEEMKLELAAVKKKSEEEVAAIKKKAEAAEAQRDLDYQALVKKNEENDARFTHLMALLEGNNRSAGN